MRARFGVVPLVLAAGKGVVKEGGKGVAWLKSPEGKAAIQKLGVTAESERQRIVLYERRVADATNPETKARWSARLEKAKARYAELRTQETLAREGIVGEGPVLEYKRNLLASEWESADEARQAVIEKQITEMDARLAQLAKEQEVLQQSKGSSAREDAEPPKRRRPLVPRLRDAETEIDRRFVSGQGTLRFTAVAPPGPARLVRLPFYPLNDAQSWTGATGIDSPGDDPTLNVAIAAGATASGPLLMRTRVLDWGRYRILGIQTNDQGVYYFGVGGIPRDVAISLSDLSVYNARTLFLQRNQVAATEFAILPASRMIDTSGASTFEPVTHYLRRRSRFFAGLRDYPVVTDNAAVSIVVNAFTNGTIAAPDPLRVPFTCNLVIEILEDRMIGDIVNPGPYARAGAVVKVGARELGLSTELRDRVQIVSSRYVPPGPRSRR